MNKASERQQRYDAENTRRVTLKLNRLTDADILARLDSEPSMQGFIKTAIREKLARESV